MFKKSQLARVFLLSAFLCNPASYSWGSGDEKEEFDPVAVQVSISRMEKKIVDIIKSNNINKSVIVIGPTGSGKSCLINLLAGKKFTADKIKNKGYFIKPDEILPGFSISHKNAVGTIDPHPWIHNGVAYWDYPGFGDTRGPSADILNAFCLKKLFQKNIKVLLVTEESNLKSGRDSGFLKVFKEVADLLPEEQIKKSVSFVVTKAVDMDDFHDYVMEDVLSGDTLKIVKKTYVNLLRSFSGKNSRFAILKKPTKNGPYDPGDSINHIQQAISDAGFTSNPKPQISLSPKSKEHIQDFSDCLNREIAESLRNNQQKVTLSSWATSRIKAHSGSLSALKVELKKTKSLIWKLRSDDFDADDPWAFSKKIEEIFGKDFDQTESKKLIDQIIFLRSINKEKAKLEPVTWARSFSENHGLLIPLVSEPDVELEGSKATIKSVLVSAEDIKNVLQKNSLEKLNVYVLHTFFMDSNVTFNSGLINLFAPNWKIMGARKTFNLKGLDGQKGRDGRNSLTGAGGDGHPGGPGKNGGIFYGRGKSFERMSRLRIDARGGNGGPGGNGGRGASGSDGADGDLNKVTSTRGHSTHYTNGRGYNETRSGTVNHYEDRGLSGQRGYRGGSPGAGGLGGYGGKVRIDSNNSYRTFLESGSNGENGISGSGGRGGLQGRDCQGQVWIRPHLYGVGRHGTVRHNSYLADQVFVTKQYVSTQNRKRAPNGPSGTGINSAGQKKPATVQDINPTAFKGYETFVEEALKGSQKPYVVSKTF